MSATEYITGLLGLNDDSTDVMTESGVVVVNN